MCPGRNRVRLAEHFTKYLTFSASIVSSLLNCVLYVWVSLQWPFIVIPHYSASQCPSSWDIVVDVRNSLQDVEPFQDEQNRLTNSTIFAIRSFIQRHSMDPPPCILFFCRPHQFSSVSWRPRQATAIQPLWDDFERLWKLCTRPHYTACITISRFKTAVPVPHFQSDALSASAEAGSLRQRWLSRVVPVRAAQSAPDRQAASVWWVSSRWMTLARSHRGLPHWSNRSVKLNVANNFQAEVSWLPTEWTGCGHRRNVRTQW